MRQNDQMIRFDRIQEKIKIGIKNGVKNLNKNMIRKIKINNN